MKKKAFTLIEICVTAMILGILTMMAIPKIMQMTYQPYAQEALTNLKIIYSAQQEYKINHGNIFVSSDISDINQALNINIVPIGGTTYDCYDESPSPLVQTCSAILPNTFILKINMQQRINKSKLEFCGTDSTSLLNKYFNRNPCCQGDGGAVGGAGGRSCP